MCATCLQCSVPSSRGSAPCWCSYTVAARSVELCEVCNDGKTKAYFSERGALEWVAVLRAPPPPPPLPLCPNWRRKLSERREKRGGGMKPTVFKLCLYVSPDCECATAFHNGGHCLFGGESVGILFQSFLKVLCLTRRGLSTSCGWRQACSLCPFPRLSAGICPLCPLCRSSGGSGLLLVHTCGDSQRCGCNSLDYICSVQLMSSVVLVMMVRGWQSSLCGVHSE